VLILVTYDVSTETSEGRRRLRNAAKICLNYGQRVQKSVFECRVNPMEAEAMERELLAIINQSEDNLRLYRLLEPVEHYIKEYGKFKAVDFTDTLIV
jgi:CRISPR-associated protein Cas2